MATELVQIACSACGYAAELPGLDPDLPAVVQCPMCGTWIRTYTAEVEAASQPPAPEPQPEPLSDPVDSIPEAPVNGCLIEAGTKTLEEQYPLTSTVTVVGREDSDINLADPTMSIHHFEIERRGGEFFIRDLDSTNQTKVNGAGITSTTLESGDRIQAGLTMLVFLAG